MAPGLPIKIGETVVATAEALYQACRFPHLPEIQRLIIDQHSPMTAKMRSKPHRKDSRSDWDDVRVAVMRWCLRAKLVQNRRRFGDLLLATGDLPIVEESARDAFWGARSRDDGTLVGQNVLGRLLMELRGELCTDPTSLRTLMPPAIRDFALLGTPVGAIHASEAPLTAELVLFDEAASEPTEAGRAGETDARRRKETAPVEPTRVRSPLAETAIKTRKKLIEVALPLEAINAASAREKSIRHGHPSTLHLWWARRPLAAARAVIFAQMVDDPSSWPERFPTEEAQDVERQHLFRIIEELVKWESTTNEDVLEQARAEIRRSWRDTCEDNKDHPRSAELFDPDKLPGFHDPFCGGGALPLEAQRLGLEAWASDLNPVAVLITKAMIEIPPKFAGRPPIGPLPPGEDEQIPVGGWSGAKGLAEDVRRYGAWMRAEAEKRIGHLYPKIAVTAEIARERPDLRPYVGRELTVIAWLWARTVQSPNPAFADVHVPVVSTFMLSTKAGKEAYIEPVIEEGGYRFRVKVGRPADVEIAKNGTRAGRAQDFRCLMSGVSIARTYVQAEGKADRIAARLMAIVADGEPGRVYLEPTVAHEQPTPGLADEPAVVESRQTFLSGSTPTRAMITGGVCSAYGLATWGHLFADRQLVALTTFLSLMSDVRSQIAIDASAASMPEDGRNLADRGVGPTAYGDAVAVLLAVAIDKLVDYNSTLCSWISGGQTIRNTFGRQALPMVWDYCEANPLGGATGSFTSGVSQVSRALAVSCPASKLGCADQLDARRVQLADRVISTDPPYYDNIGYAVLSDFFYVWMRQSLSAVFPSLFSTLAAPKDEELIASPYRHGGQDGAKAFFLSGMTEAMRGLSEQSHPGLPVTIYYAFKQAESDGGSGTSSTGWETFLDAVIRAGFAISGTWPVRTELANKVSGVGHNMLASSIVLVCRPRDPSASIATRRDFLAALKRELPFALTQLQHGNIAPVDLAQSAIGPGMAIYTRYAKVLDADGSPLSVRDALALINQALDEVLAEQEGDFDADTRWAVAWFEQNGFAEGAFGVAETLSKAKNTSVGGMEGAGIVFAGRGKVRLLRPEELPEGWDPVRDERLTVWEATHHLVRALDEGEQTASELAARLGGVADTARELAYRLYVICERKKRAPEALAYNALVQSWPEIQRLAAEGAGASVQETLGI